MRDGLLLDGATVSALTAIHSNVLLSAWVDPCGRSGVVVNKVWSAFGRMSLLPARWKLSGASSGRARSHHAHCAGSVRLLWGRLPVRERWRIRACAVLWQHTVLMASTFLLRLRCHGVLGISLTESCTRPDPGGLPSVVVNIICSSQVILTPFPSIRQSSLRIFKSTVCSSAGAIWSRAVLLLCWSWLWRARRRTIGALAGSLRGWLGGALGWSLSRVYV